MVAVVLALLSTPAVAEVRLPHVFGSHMVLQCDLPVYVWGWANPGESVQVALAGNSANVQADDNGRWQLELPGLPAGGPYAMMVAGMNTIQLEDILVGEVWLCSGQSNMWRPLYWPQRKWGVVDYEREIEAADLPRLRFLNLSRVPGGDHPNPLRATPAEDAVGCWERCSPKAAANFSATAQFFGRMLLAELDVPVGLINASYGGSKIEAWISPAGFRPMTVLQDIADQAETCVPNGKVTHHSPSALFNSMIHPLVPLPLRGFLWYQGESNVGDGPRYEAKMEALIGGWRDVWGREDIPFYYVLLPPFRYGGSAYHLPQLREAQAAALVLPHTGMVVTLDVGDLNDIHPRQKKQVGHRLAMLALAKDYGRDELPYSGPVVRSKSCRNAGFSPN